MRIAFISRILFLSGVTTHMRDLGAELVKRGHEVTILTSGNQFPDNPASTQLEQSLYAVGIKIKILPLTRDHLSNRFRYFLSLIRSTLAIRKELRQSKYDIIHIHTLSLSFIPRLLGYKFVSTTHNGNMHLSSLLKNADEEIAISDEIYQEILKRGVSPDHVHLIYNGVSSSFLVPPKENDRRSFFESYGIDPMKVIILFVGTIFHTKGLDNLCEALSLLPQYAKEKIHTIFVGNYDTEEYRRWMERIIEEKKLNSLITILGYRNPHDFYYYSDIFVLPSRREGFPLVSIEAMMGECCVIRTNTEGFEAQIKDGETGFIFPNEDPASLSRILIEVIEDEELRKRIAKNGRKYAQEHFTASIMAEKTIGVYEKLIIGGQENR